MPSELEATGAAPVETTPEAAAAVPVTEEATGVEPEADEAEVRPETPSDGGADLAETILEALSGARELFHSSLAVTVDQVRSYLEAHEGEPDEAPGRVARELGPFALGRIDPGKLTALTGAGEAVGEAELAPMRRALETLSGLLARGRELHGVRVGSGADLPSMVAGALGDAGRAFGAARVFELARTGRYEAERHGAWMESFPFGSWNPDERKVAPPLVVEVDGGDLRAAALSEYLDGAQKIALIVRGTAPPAPLVRLITPGVFVMQTTDADEIGRLAEVEGPGVAALVPDSAARFVHQPDRGDGPGRLEVLHLPEEAPRAGVGATSAFQQREELRQLARLATGVAAAPAAAAANEAEPGEGPPADVDLLAAWLLRQADLTDI